MICFVLFLILFLLVFYEYGTWSHSYWKKRGIKHDRALPFLGTNLKQFTKKATIAMLAAETYRRYPDEKVVGFYRGNKPELVIRDPEIVKRIVLTDFQHFYAKEIIPEKSGMEPLTMAVFGADGDLWHLVRKSVSPVFSSRKLKVLFTIIQKKINKLQDIAEKLVTKESYDIRELMAKYTTDFVGAWIFDVDTDCFTNDSSQFRKIGKRLFQTNLRDVFVFFLKFSYPQLSKNIPLVDPFVTDTCLYLYQNAARNRNQKSVGKIDLMDFLLKLKENGKVVGESIENKNPDGTPKLVSVEWNDTLLSAQLMGFYAAGFETSSGMSSYALHQLAFNPDCQEKAIREVDSVLKKHDNQITLESIEEMKYLQMVFKEALRMYPSVAFIERVCKTHKYTFPEIGLTIDKGTKMIIPINALQNDEKYFANPESFDPERFQPDKEREIRKFTYLPFGEGPRACIGRRLGICLAIGGIAGILQRFTVEPAACSMRRPRPDPAVFFTENFIGGLPLKLKKRDR